MKHQVLAILLFGMLLCSACSDEPKRFAIGVSQCSEDIWREKQNQELRMGAYFHDNVELKFAAAYDSDERQVQQIDSLVNEGIDLLIVAPNQVQTISPAIDRAYDRGIPVIVFERKTNSQKYSAFIGADNYEMGRTMGEYIVSQLHGQGNVLEIKGLEGSSPSIERHLGFMDALKKAPGITVVGSLQGDWTEQTAETITRQWRNGHDEHVDLVFGANDRTAMGARKALGPGCLYCGIDGLPGKNGGIQLVRDSLLVASYIYPTHGDQLIDLAVRILEGEPYEKETLLMSALVTRDNAKVLLMESEEMMRQAYRLDLLHEKANGYLHKLDTQRLITWLAVSIIVLLIVVFVLFYLYHLRKTSIQRERVVNNLWNLEEKAAPSPVSVPMDASPQEQEALDGRTASVATPLSSEGETGGEVSFLARFKEAVESHLSDSELTIEDLAAEMHLSRVQLYRKVKAITGSSPVEMLRTARLNRGYQLLLTTDKTVSEVTYAVGFTAPSYFTKCFKDEFGQSPTELTRT